MIRNTCKIARSSSRELSLLKSLIIRSWFSSSAPSRPKAACGEKPFTFSGENDVHNLFQTSTSTLACFQLLDEKGTLKNKQYKLNHDPEFLKKIYKYMLTTNVADTIFYEAQRQGRITFYMTTTGEEGAAVASAAALKDQDIIYGQYRETGAVLWRGYTLEEMTNQLFSNSADYGKGRQMPMHFGARRLNFHTISSPLATQIPQASGAAYALKIKGENDACVLCYFGEGAASEGDFHAALNFASTLRCPVIFFCRNNGYAISTPSNEQYAGDGIVGRALGYGIPAIRVDGNDPLAVLEATQAARQLCITGRLSGQSNSHTSSSAASSTLNFLSRPGPTPVFIEAMTYRAGHHSTSDDSSQYRDAKEIKEWTEKNNPIIRMRNFLQTLGVWDEKKDAELRSQLRQQVLSEMSRAEQMKRPPISDMFKDVFDTIPPLTLEHQEHLLQHLKKYEKDYAQDVSHYAPEDPKRQ